VETAREGARPPGGSDGFVDPRTLMAIKNLELRARIVVEGFWKGIHRSPYHGFSVEFTEYRQYTPGDDPRYLDWRLYARSDRYYIKKFEDETNLRCFLLVDNSRSMTYGSLGWTKAQYGHTLAATLAYFLSRQGDAVGLLTFDEVIREYLPARNRPGHLRHLMLLLEKPPAGAGTDINAALNRIIDVVRRRGLVVLISDLLTPLESLEKNLGALAAWGHEIILFHVLDPAELKFTFDKASLFEDVESRRGLYVDPDQARRDYLRRFDAHNAAVQTIVDKIGASYVRFGTDRPLELALFDFLRARVELRKRSRRSGGIVTRGE
jgi:uncharacterized protein (DUF58 family)